ncbi:MAG: DMT family transporter [Chloroflexi bacterium]|nr:DMT family transporter [Chloroflexota bacterium]
MGELAALIAAFTWSGTSVALTSLSARTSPVALSAFRLSAGAIVLGVLLLLTGQWADLGGASASNYLAIVGSGFIGYGLGDTFYIRALSLLGMQRTFPISMSAFIVLTVVGGIVWLDEPFGWGLLTGGMLIGLGTYLIVVRRLPSRDRIPVFAPDEAETAGSPPPTARVAPGRLGAAEGYVLIAAVAVFWAAATLWLAGGRGDLGALPTGAMRTPAGAASLLAFGFATQRQNMILPFRDRRHIGAIAAAGVVGTAFGSLLYVYAILTAGAGRTVILNATSPLMALPLSIFLLKEPFTRRVGAGTALCVAGIVLVVA